MESETTPGSTGGQFAFLNELKELHKTTFKENYPTMDVPVAATAAAPAPLPRLQVGDLVDIRGPDQDTRWYVGKITGTGTSPQSGVVTIDYTNNKNDACSATLAETSPRLKPKGMMTNQPAATTTVAKMSDILLFPTRLNGLTEKETLTVVQCYLRERGFTPVFLDRQDKEVDAMEVDKDGDLTMTQAPTPAPVPTAVPTPASASDQYSLDAIKQRLPVGKVAKLNRGGNPVVVLDHRVVLNKVEILVQTNDSRLPTWYGAGQFELF